MPDAPAPTAGLAPCPACGRAVVTGQTSGRLAGGRWSPARRSIPWSGTGGQRGPAWRKAGAMWRMRAGVRRRSTVYRSSPPARQYPGLRH